MMAGVILQRKAGYIVPWPVDAAGVAAGHNALCGMLVSVMSMLPVGPMQGLRLHVIIF
jgi:hypothetical protein